jgi:hypothetical protein
MGGATSKLRRLSANFKNCSDLSLDRAGFDPLGGPDVLNRNADRFVGDLIRVIAPAALTGDYFRNRARTPA